MNKKGIKNSTGRKIVREKIVKIYGEKRETSEERKKERKKSDSLKMVYQKPHSSFQDKLRLVRGGAPPSIIYVGSRRQHRRQPRRHLGIL
jgi:hypothetical protein